MGTAGPLRPVLAWRSAAPEEKAGRPEEAGTLPACLMKREGVGDVRQEKAISD